MNISKMFLIKLYNDCIQILNSKVFCKLKFGAVGSYKSSKPTLRFVTNEKDLEWIYRDKGHN